MKALLSVFVAAGSYAFAGGETALEIGEKIKIENSSGILEVEAKPQLERSFTWNNQTRSVIMIARKETWYGSNGIYYPGPGEHWKDNKGITRGVIDEGILRFASMKDFSEWRKGEFQSFQDYKFFPKGRIANWYTVPARKQLDCNIWKILIAGKELTKEQWETLGKR